LKGEVLVVIVLLYYVIMYLFLTLKHTLLFGLWDGLAYLKDLLVFFGLMISVYTRKVTRFTRLFACAYLSLFALLHLAFLLTRFEELSKMFADVAVIAGTEIVVPKKPYLILGLDPSWGWLLDFWDIWHIIVPLLLTYYFARRGKA